MSIKVYSEIGKLKKVVLHRPGKEVENIIPETFEELLFDDSMFLEIAQKEHDEFAKALKKLGVEVYYIEQLAADAISTSDSARKEFIEEFSKNANKEKTEQTKIIEFLSSIKNNKELIDKCISGIRYKEVGIDESKKGVHVFISNPLPNVLFTRDNWASIGNGITLNKMYTETRNRETIFGKYVFKYHPDYKETPKIFDREDYLKSKKNIHIEGGDELVLSEKALAIGISLRTSREAVIEVAKTLFNSDSKFEEVYGFHIPVGRSWMHLDTVFTQIDKDKFTVYSNKPIEVEKFTSDGKGGVKTEKLTQELSKILEGITGVPVKLIQCGNGDPIDGNREQWNDGSNSLAVAPNHIVAYNRNHVTIKLLKEAGVKVTIVPSSELSRGRGGPRCMSMPLEREILK